MSCVAQSYSSNSSVTFAENIISTKFWFFTGGQLLVTGGGAICSTAGEIAPPVNMLDEALPRSLCPEVRCHYRQSSLVPVTAAW